MFVCVCALPVLVVDSSSNLDQNVADEADGDAAHGVVVGHAVVDVGFRVGDELAGEIDVPGGEGEGGVT